MTSTITDKRFGEERALYHLIDTEVSNCRFEGAEDGESALKECRQILLSGCYLDLRYPLWHGKGLEVKNSTMTVNCRAALWYDEEVKIVDSKLLGIKALRECRDVELTGCEISSPEFCWRCDGVKCSGVKLNSEYAFFESKNLDLSNLEFSGKYSFQYVENMHIDKSALATKDAFWHTKNVTVKDSVIKGEYLGWYSENLTLIRCRIEGTQPFCYCKHLRLIDCTMENTDLAFEYSEVEADIQGTILSIKNPRAGYIVADEIGKIIKEDSVYPLKAEIRLRTKEQS